jgi:hypothetical protein
MWPSAKGEFTVCFSLPNAALGKEALCRVPDTLHSAKPLTLGKGRVSGSVSLSLYLISRLFWMQPQQLYRINNEK